MNSIDALNVSSSIQKLIIEKFNDEISKKELINKKLSPFLLHQVFTGKISPNFAPIVQEVEQKPYKSMHNKQIQTQPKSLQKDNLNPKSAHIDQGSSKFLKSQSKRTRRFTVSQKKPSFFDVNQIKELNSINEASPSSSKNANLNKNIEIASMPKLSRKLSKHKNDPIKLNMKKGQIHEVEDEIESQLRSKKERQEEEKMSEIQIEVQKSKRYEKLKQKFKIYENNVQTISFDFDGSIINLEDEEKNHIFKAKPVNHISIESRRSSHSRTFETIPLQSHENSLKIEDSQISENKKNHRKIGLPFQTAYKINYKDLNTISYFDECPKLKESPKHSKVPSKDYSNSDHQSIADWHLSLNSEKKKKSSKQTSSVSQELSFENSQVLNQAHAKPSSSVKIFKDSSAAQRSARKEKQAKLQHEEGEKQFTNNFKRQTSTIPYLEIKEGIRYQEEITIKDDENDLGSQKIRFATIQKPKSGSEYSNGQVYTTKSNWTFRSYLPFSQEGYQKSKETMMNKTISVLSESGKSIKLYFHKDQKQSEELKRTKAVKENDEFAFFDNPNPIVIRDTSHTKANTTRPMTTQSGVRNRVQSSRPFFAEKDSKDMQLFEMKQKMLLKQKNRVMSSHTARIVK